MFASREASPDPSRFFNDNSWRPFIALVWPAKLENRGVPDTTAQRAPTAGPLVFESYEAD